MTSRIGKEDLVLYSISKLIDNEDDTSTYSKDQLSNALDISISTLDLYMSKLKNQGYIIRHKKRYPRSISDSVEITIEGRKKTKEFKDVLNDEFLTPEDHNIQSIVPVGFVIDRIKDPLEEILFLSLYHSIRSFDLQSYLRMMKDLRADSNMVRVLDDLQEQPHQSQLPVAGTFFRACFFGDISQDELLSMETCYDNVFNLLLIAEANQKQGRLQQALTIYDHLLSGKIKLTENQWVIAKVGLALNTYKDGRGEEGIKIAESVIEETSNKIMQAYGKQIIARILSSSDRAKESMELYNSAVRSFDHHGIPLLCCVAYNNRGVAYYRMKNIDRAIEDWDRAIKFAKKAKSSYSEATILTNIADIESSRGNIQLALKQLEKSRSILNRIGDLEGIAGVEYNLSLVLLDNKELDKALDHYKKGDRVAFPLPPPNEREEREISFIERAKENGFDDIDRSVFKR